MTFERVLAADAVAMVAALALPFAMGVDWYGTTAGDEARRIERLAKPHGALAGEVSRAVEERAGASAEEAEKNAFQLDGAIDRVILAGLLATIVLALAAGFLRAARRRFEPPLTPTALAGIVASVTALLVVFRTIEQPGFDPATTVKPGAPLALAALGLIGLACTVAHRAEASGTAWREPVRAPKGDAAEPRRGEAAAADGRAP